jgi:hypothetical protein
VTARRRNYKAAGRDVTIRYGANSGRGTPDNIDGIAAINSGRTSLPPWMAARLKKAICARTARDACS